MPRTAKHLNNPPPLSFMLQSIREKHIDINPIIEEELNTLIQSSIEFIVRNIYTMAIEMRSEDE